MVCRNRIPISKSYFAVIDASPYTKASNNLDPSKDSYQTGGSGNPSWSSYSYASQSQPPQNPYSAYPQYYAQYPADAYNYNAYYSTAAPQNPPPPGVNTATNSTVHNPPSSAINYPQPPPPPPPSQPGVSQAGGTAAAPPSTYGYPYGYYYSYPYSYNPAPGQAANYSQPPPTAPPPPSAPVAAPGTTPDYSYAASKAPPGSTPATANGANGYHPTPPGSQPPLMRPSGGSNTAESGKATEGPEKRSYASIVKQPVPPSVEGKEKEKKVESKRRFDVKPGGVKEAPAYISVKPKGKLLEKRIVFDSDTPSTTQSAQPTPPSSTSSRPKEISTSETNEQGETGQKSWPVPLKNYINRAFENIPESYKDKVQEELKEIVTDAFRRGRINTTDWDNMPLPRCVERFKNKTRENLDFIDLSSTDVEKTKSSKRKNTTRDSTPDIPLLSIEETEEELRKREKRLKRFQTNESNAKQPSPAPPPEPPTYNPDVIDWDEYTIVGTCQTLEKQYLRLTSAPDPSTVRPLPVLKQTLELLKFKWKKESNYTYICDQFKSMRQDLTVQRIKNDFTVQVYEIHARIALEKGDLGEFNQCQSQLNQLYKLGLPGKVMEFTAYRILYLLHTQNRTEVNGVMAELTEEQKQDRAVAHALRVRSAIATSNYHLFFLLYRSAPFMCGYLMDHFVARERVKAMATICKAYRPSISLEFLRHELAFEDLEALSKFLGEHGAGKCTDKPNGMLLTKITLPIIEEAKKKYCKIDIKGQI
ncbi:uncharacterized protein VTP21DRAFT_8606 [Calcarisporiella thermophila]|uniref:uncharacterized protein n=1 Tax=Calcarisporiella thermophila TaxID=911321 RepID=UPI00374201E4